MTTALPECLLGCLFAKSREIKLENYGFHKKVFQMKKKPEYTDMLARIRFTGSPVNPYSEALEEGLFNLQFAGALSRENPELVVYSKTDRFDGIFAGLMQNVSEDNRAVLEKFADEFLGQVS